MPLPIGSGTAGAEVVVTEGGSSAVRPVSALLLLIAAVHAGAVVDAGAHREQMAVDTNSRRGDIEQV